MQSSIIKDSAEYLQKVGESYAEAFHIAASIAFMLNDPENMKLALMRAVSLNPESELVKNLYPELEEIKSFIMTIIEKHERVLSHDQDNAASWAIISACFLTLGDFTNAFALFIYTLRLKTPALTPDFYYGLGISYQHFGYFEDSLNTFLHISKNHPKYQLINDVKYRMALCYQQMLKNRNALSLFESLVQNPPQKLKGDDLLLQIAHTHYLLDNINQAENQIQGLVAKYPKHVQLFVYSCYLRLNTGDKTDIRTDVLNRLSENPKNPDLLLLAARLELMHENYDGAHLYYSRCSDDFSNEVQFYTEVAYLYYLNKQYSETKRLLQLSLSIDPDNYSTWLNLIFVISIMEPTSSLASHYRKAMDACSNTYAIQDRMNSDKREYIKPCLTKEIQWLPEKCSKDYIMATPALPTSSYGVEKSLSCLSLLSSMPGSIFEV